MDPHRDEDLLEIETQLRASAPTPARTFLADAEQRLFPPRRARREARARRPLLVAVGAAGAMASVAFALSLAGQGPLAPGGGEDVDAGEDCRFVPVERTVRTPELVKGRDGRPTIRYQERRAERTVERCR